MAEKRGGERVLVYVPKPDAEKLKAKGHDPAKWVRGLVKHALSKVQ